MARKSHKVLEFSLRSKIVGSCTPFRNLETHCGYYQLGLFLTYCLAFTPSRKCDTSLNFKCRIKSNLTKTNSSPHQFPLPAAPGATGRGSRSRWAKERSWCCSSFRWIASLLLSRYASDTLGSEKRGNVNYLQKSCGREELTGHLPWHILTSHSI